MNSPWHLYKNTLLFRCKLMILPLSRLCRNVNRKDYNDRNFFIVPNLGPVECGAVSPVWRSQIRQIRTESTPGECGPTSPGLWARHATLGRPCVRDRLGPPPVACQPRGLRRVSRARRHPSQPKPDGEVLTGRNRQRLLHGRVKSIADIADNPAFVAVGRRGPSLTPPGIGVGARVPWGFAAVTRP